jgi:hypothetical protein
MALRKELASAKALSHTDEEKTAELLQTAFFFEIMGKSTNSMVNLFTSAFNRNVLFADSLVSFYLHHFESKYLAVPALTCNARCLTVDVDILSLCRRFWSDGV